MNKFIISALLLVFCGCGSKQVDQYVGSGPVQLYLQNKSNLDNNKLPTFVAAVNDQLQGEFKRVWAIDAQISWQDPPNSSYRTVVLLDTFKDQFPEAYTKSLGFHTTGTLAYVDVSTCGEDDLITLALSHEVLEMLTNPNVDRTGYEAADPVYPRQYAYRKGTVLVTDFVYPSFYNPLAPGPYDQTGQVKSPLTPAPGGVLFATLQSMLNLANWERNIKPNK